MALPLPGLPRRSGAVVLHLLLSVGESALERLYVVSFGLADDLVARVTAGSTLLLAECGYVTISDRTQGSTKCLLRSGVDDGRSRW